MPLLDHEIARRENGKIEWRSDPLRLRWELHDLVTSDSHRLRVVLSCGVRVLDTPSERKMLEEAFLGIKPVATAHEVADHFRDAFQSAAERTAPTRHVSDWLDDQISEEFVDLLRAAGNAVAFTCGVELLPPFRLELSSPTLERQRLEEVGRAAAERRGAEQVEHLQRATRLMREFEAMRAAAPGLSRGDILRQINPADQAELLHSLQRFGAAEKQTEAVWIVAGSDLLRVDPRVNPLTATILPLPQELGPLRTVSVNPIANGRSLLIGARAGVMVVDPDRLDETEFYADPGIDSPHGFSRVVRWRGGIWACHRDGGIVGWRDGNREPQQVLRPADTGGVVRHLCVLDETRLLFAGEFRLFTFANSQATPVAEVGETVALLPFDDRVIVVSSAGRVRVLARRSLETISETRPAGDVCCAALLPWMGSARLLVSPEQGSIVCVGLDDPLITHYTSPHHGIPMLAASDDLIAGVSSDRQRVILWQTGEGKKPAAELHVAAINKRRISGIAMG